MNPTTPLYIPCFGTSQPYYTGERPRSDSVDTITKIALIASSILVIITLVLLQSPPAIAGTCVIATFLGSIALLIFAIVKSILYPNSDLKKLEKLTPAKQLAAQIQITPQLQEEIKQVTRAIYAGKSNGKTTSISQSEDGTMTFTLQSAPDLQFRFALSDRKGFLTPHYENMVYAQAICQREGYNHLFVQPIKPFYVNIGGFRRSILIEKVAQAETPPDKDLETAVRQMVRFIFITGRTWLNFTSFQFLPVDGNKLALQKLYHLTEKPFTDAELNENVKIARIIGRQESLLASLNSVALVNIVSDELNQLSPVVQRDDESPSTYNYRTLERKIQVNIARERCKKLPPNQPTIDHISP